MRLTEQEILNIFRECEVTELGLEEEDRDEGNYDLFLKDIDIPDGWSFEYEHGASKLVILLYKQGEEPIVIKIPMSGMWYSKYDSETENWLPDEFKLFSGAICNRNPDNRWDYCSVEEELYQYAKAEGIELFFAETRCIGEANGRPIYVQSFVDEICECGDRHFSQDSYHKAKELSDEHDCKVYMEWLANAIDWYSEAMITKLLDFLDMYEVGDLHSGNVGYVGGRPVLLDYSDFNY